MINLKSNKLKIIEIKSETQAKFFKDLKVGDIIQINTLIGLDTENTGVQKTKLTVKNLKTGEEINRTVREVVLVSLNFKFEEVDK